MLTHHPSKQTEPRQQFINYRLPGYDATMLAQLSLLLPCLYIVLAPVADLLPGIDMYNEKRILEGILLLVYALGLLLTPVLRRQWLGCFLTIPSVVRHAIMAVLALGILSSLLATEPRAALLEVSLYCLLFIAGILVASQYQHAPRRFNVVIITSITVAAMAYLTLVLAGIAAAWLETGTLDQRSLFGNFSHIRFFSQFQSWTLPLIVLPLLMFNRLSRAWQALLLFIAGGWWMLAFASGTRGTLLGLAVACVLIAVIYGKHARRWFGWQSAALSLGLVMYTLLFIVLPGLSSTDSSSVIQESIGREMTHSTGRIHLWLRALELVARHPWVGVGPMHYNCDLLPNYPAHPHNTMLQLGAEWGLPAAILLVCVVCYALWSWIQRTRLRFACMGPADREQLLYPAVLGAAVTALTHALFSGIFIMPMSQVLAFMLLGWMLAIYQGPAMHNQALQTTTSTHAAVLLVTFFACVGLLYGTLPDVFQLHELQDNFQASHPSVRLLPRFWQQGRICD